MPGARTRKMLIVAQDPAILDETGRPLVTEVDVPAEELGPGPCGYRVHVIDYDASTRTLYKPAELDRLVRGRFSPVFSRNRWESRKFDFEDPGFHAQNVYAIAMRTLARFEFALGRRVGWGFRSQGHQIKVAPHAFADANAFYSKEDEALLFGYFPDLSGTGTVFSCLSHDVVAHESTHALLDGLRWRYTDPSSPDQAAFHEGFSDVVALLSVFSLRDVVKAVLDRSLASGDQTPPGAPGLVHEQSLTVEALRESMLLGLAKQMGQEMSLARGRALRQSALLKPSPGLLEQDEFEEPHRRGEIFVAAMMNAFLQVWTRRLESLGRIQGHFFDRGRVAEEAADAADYLLTMTIRALDYTPPVHLEFGDFLSALLTADHEIRPDDSKYQYRQSLRDSFLAYDIKPCSRGEGGRWLPPKAEMRFDRIRFESMSRNPDEVFRFVWENRKALGLFEGAYTRVLTVRPCLRIAPDDGFPLRETVAECIQQLELEARELGKLRIRKPALMPDDTKVKLQGGIALVFDEYGRLKFAVSNQLYDEKNPEVRRRQSRRLEYLWEYGQFRRGASLTRRFSSLHRLRATGSLRVVEEAW